MENEITLPGFSSEDSLAGLDFSADIPSVLQDAPDVSNLPDLVNTPVEYSSEEPAASLRAYEAATFPSQNSVPQVQRQETIHEYMERESNNNTPVVAMEQHGFHEPSWEAASERTAQRIEEAGGSGLGSIFGDPTLSVFEHLPGQEPEVVQKREHSGDDLAEAIIVYIETFYSRQLKKCRPGTAETVGKTLSSKIKNKIIPEYFQKKVGDGNPHLKESVSKKETPQTPGKERFDFQKFVRNNY